MFGHDVAPDRLAYHLIAGLAFKGYITTNFDPLLATAADLEGLRQVYAYPHLPVAALGADERPIYYIHGRAHPAIGADELVFARDDFMAAYDDPGVVKGFLLQVLSYFPLIFVGCQLNEPEVQDALRRAEIVIRELGKQGMTSPGRLILLPKEEGSRADEEDERYGLLNIRVLRYHTENPAMQWELDRALREVLRLIREPEVSIGEDLPPQETHP
jgi:hypothetical protein